MARKVNWNERQAVAHPIRYALVSSPLLALVLAVEGHLPLVAILVIATAIGVLNYVLYRPGGAGQRSVARRLLPPA